MRSVDFQAQHWTSKVNSSDVNAHRCTWATSFEVVICTALDSVIHEGLFLGGRGGTNAPID